MYVELIVVYLFSDAYLHNAEDLDLSFLCLAPREDDVTKGEHLLFCCKMRKLTALYFIDEAASSKTVHEQRLIRASCITLNYFFFYVLSNVLLQICVARSKTTK